MSNKRIERLSEAYLKELSEILHHQVRDPCLSGVYITQVVFSPDLRLAKIYFNVSGGRVREQEVIKGFERSKGYLRRELANRVTIKYSPDIKFYFDDSFEVKNKIDQLFKEIERHKDAEG